MVKLTNVSTIHCCSITIIYNLLHGQELIVTVGEGSKSVIGALSVMASRGQVVVLVEYTTGILDNEVQKMSLIAEILIMV